MVLDTGLRYDQLENLSDEELCALGRAGRRQAEDVLATRYHWLVRACARPYFLIGGDTEDLMQEGMFGLIKAMREFDPARSSLFRPFAGLCIHQQVCSALKRDASQKNAPLNQSVPLNPSLLNASPTFAQVDPELLLIDREKADLLIDTFWMMLRIESEVEEVVLPADSGDGSEESEDTETQTEYILHITVTSVPVDDLAHDLSFTDDQMDILHQLLSDEMRPMLVQMCGTGTSTGTVPPVVDGSMIWPLPGHTSLTTHFGEADAFGNP